MGALRQPFGCGNILAIGAHDRGDQDHGNQDHGATKLGCSLWPNQAAACLLARSPSSFALVDALKPV